ncbi:hypothetical protein LNO36_13880 [Klebsiella variicola subsp. variicola]|nr:hypothetical protein [Klebsiella variicola subsp. variicola]
MADMPQVKRGLEAPPQQQIIQPLAQAITRRNDLLYAIVTDMHGIRYSHPDTSIIGKRFIGRDILPTLQGKENVAINHGVLAPALRVFTPVFNDQRQQIGVVVVGISLSKVDEQIANSRWDVLLTILFSALVCALGTEPGTRSEARPAGAGAAGDFHPVSTASGHASRPEGGRRCRRCPRRSEFDQPGGAGDPLFRPGQNPRPHATARRPADRLAERRADVRPRTGMQWPVADRQYGAHSQPGSGGRRHLYLPR